MRRVLRITAVVFGLLVAASAAHAAQSVDELVEALKDLNWETRRDATVPLGKVGPTATEAVRALRETLEDTVQHGRLASRSRSPGR